MPSSHNTGMNIFAFMSVHIAVYCIDDVVVVNAACPYCDTCATTTNLPPASDTARIMSVRVFTSYSRRVFSLCVTLLLHVTIHI